jgi:hypothetical protein
LDTHHRLVPALETLRDTSTARPSPELVGRTAAEFSADSQLSPDGKPFLMAGFPAFGLPSDEDMAMLRRESFRALALRFAIAFHEGDCADIVLPPVVAGGLQIVLETTGYGVLLAAMNLTIFHADAVSAPCHPGSYTWSCYEVAGWGPPPPIWRTEGDSDTAAGPTARPQ